MERSRPDQADTRPPQCGTGAAWAAIDRGLMRGEFRRLRMHLRHRDGSSRWVQTGFYPAYGDDGSLAQVIRLATERATSMMKRGATACEARNG